MKEDPLETLDLLGSNLEPNSKIGTSFEWEPVDKDGNLTNFFEVVTAPDMQKPTRNPWGAVKTFTERRARKPEEWYCAQPR